jgi:uroporphyrin-III C-methyltransferase / precorrin-2 dehydrogenase / sirohydrochlorin ferrochelatase
VNQIDIQPLTPRETRAQRVAPLSVLPVFFDLRGRRVVVAGTGEGCLWKVELLAAAGACVEVYDATPSPDLWALQAAPPAGCVLVISRSWTPADLTGAAAAIGALEGDEATRFAAAARGLGVPVNVVDTPGLGTFNFGTIVNRAPLVIGISTDGAAPVLGQAIRGRIEAMLHPALGAWVARAKTLRDVVKARFEMGAERRDLWRRFAERALAAHTPPDDGDLADLMTGGDPGARGSVVLVGAGPGDPELLTIKALRALQAADVILYDRLVGDGILELGRREARRMLVGKTGGGRSCRQSDINAVMVALALAGQRVVRLKGGDPMIFGRANEEMAACRAAGVPVSVVPGVTAALGAAAELNLSLTDRTLARRVQFVTGHSESGQAPDHDWPRLADPWTTTVFYMGGRTFGEMLPKLLAAGLDAQTPAIAISGATRPGSRHIVATAGTLVTAIGELDPALPCLIMVGRAIGALSPTPPTTKAPTAAAVNVSS